MWHNNYTIDGGQHAFERVHSQRDLRVIFDQKLTFVYHIDSIIASATAEMDFIKRTLKNTFTVESEKVLYCALVTSKFEYASVVWQPQHQIHTVRIELVQKNFVKWALRNVFQWDEGLKLPSYQIRCDKLDIQPLWRRRMNVSIFLRYDLQLEKIVSWAQRNEIVNTRMQYDLNQRERNSRRNCNFIREPVLRTDFAHNQPFYVACTNI